MFKSAKTTPSPYGITPHVNKAKVKAITGAIKNITKLACVGNIVSLVNSFTPSAKGCKRPHTPTTLGPTLNCIEANIFRSANVT
jgi:hypothetical protein